MKEHYKNHTYNNNKTQNRKPTYEGSIEGDRNVGCVLSTSRQTQRYEIANVSFESLKYVHNSVLSWDTSLFTRELRLNNTEPEISWHH